MQAISNLALAYGADSTVSRIAPWFLIWHAQFWVARIISPLAFTTFNKLEGPMKGESCRRASNHALDFEQMKGASNTSRSLTRTQQLTTTIFLVELFSVLGCEHREHGARCRHCVPRRHSHDV